MPLLYSYKMRCVLYTLTFFILWDVQRLDAEHRGESHIPLSVIAFHFARAGFVLVILDLIHGVTTVADARRA
jgi:hypothetical protein